MLELKLEGQAKTRENRKGHQVEITHTHKKNITDQGIVQSIEETAGGSRQSCGDIGTAGNEISVLGRALPGGEGSTTLDKVIKGS